MSDRAEGQHAYNILHKMAEQEATRTEIEENRRKSETVQRVRRRASTSLEMTELAPSSFLPLKPNIFYHINCLHSCLYQRRVNAELSAKRATRVKNAGAVEQRRLFKQQEAEALKGAEREMIEEYSRNSHAATKVCAPAILCNSINRRLTGCPVLILEVAHSKGTE